MAYDIRPSLRRADSKESADTAAQSAAESFSSSFSSIASSNTSRGLLFGEIPSVSDLSSTTTYRRKRSVCHLVPSGSRSFLRLWHSEECRNGLLQHLDRATLADFRLVCHDFSSRAAPFLFDVVGSDFKSSSFTRPARIAALERIGEHVKTFTFSMPHSPETVLPPLIDPLTGEQHDFVYTPQVHKPTTLIEKVKEPKYGSWEMTDLLVRQYPPLFHAATNVPAFLKVFESIPNLEHLKISCPDADSPHRYRRGIVDFALISLRIAVERAPLPYLDALSLVNLHPSGLLYLQPLLGPGSTPGSSRRWTQIRRLFVRMDSFPTCDAKTHAEHLKRLHVYLRAFAPNLTHLSFHWNGDKGANPLSLETEPCFVQDPVSLRRAPQGILRPQPSRLQKRAPPSSPSMFSPSTFAAPPPPPPKPAGGPRRGQAHLLQPLTLPNLTHLTVENSTTASAAQISSFLGRHKRTITELRLDITLRSGTWEEALEPVTRMADDSRRRMLARDSLLFSPASSVGSPDIGMRPWAGGNVSARNPQPLNSYSTTPRPHESMDVPVMLFRQSETPRVKFEFAPPPPEPTREPVIEGPLLPPPTQEMVEVKGSSGIPLRRWFSKGRAGRAKNDALAAAGHHHHHCEDRVGKFFKGGILGWR